MAAQSTYTTYPSSEEHLPGSDSFGLSNPPTDSAQMESWMADILNQDLLSSHPVNWDDVLDSSFDPDLVQPPSAQYHPESLPSLSSTNGYDYTNSSSESNLPGPDNLDFVNTFSDSTAFDLQSSLHPSNSTFPDCLERIQHQDDTFASLTNTFQTSIPQAENNSHQVFDQVASAFKDLARARAAADTRRVSKKQKQRDATIALYLERLRDTCNEAVAMLAASDADECDTPETNTQLPNFNLSWQQSSTSGSSFSSPNDTNILPSSDSPESNPESSSGSQHTQDQSLSPSATSPTQPPVSGGVELIMDLNMNRATSLPRKHRPRTQAQRQRYLAVRNQGACEKHKRQHKRCTCIDKALATTPTQSTSAVGRRARVDQSSVAIPSTRRPVPTVPEPSVGTNTLLQVPSPKSAVKLCPGGLAPAGNSGSEPQQSAPMNISGQFPSLSAQQPSGMTNVSRRYVAQGCHPSANLETTRWRPKSIRGRNAMAANGERNPSSSMQHLPINNSRIYPSADSNYGSSVVHSGTSGNAYRRLPSSIRLENSAHNNTPIPLYDPPLDYQTLQHNAVPTEDRFNFFLSPQQQRQQCNHTNSTYGTAAQPCDIYAQSGAYVPSSLLLLTIGGPGRMASIASRSGFRLQTLAYNFVCNRVKLGGRQQSFVLWCFIWISLLAMSSIFKGIFR